MAAASYKSYVNGLGFSGGLPFQPAAKGTGYRPDAPLRELRELVETDELTKAVNYAGMKKAFKRELALMARHPSKGCVLVAIDLDGFKGINDTFGHAAGDACLIAFTKAMSELIRSTDVFCRKGGDEFFLIASNTTMADFQDHFVAIMDKINQGYPVRVGEKFVHIKGSWGMAEVIPPPNNPANSRDNVMNVTLDDVMNIADKALYAHKESKGDTRKTPDVRPAPPHEKEPAP